MNKLSLGEEKDSGNATVHWNVSQRRVCINGSIIFLIQNTTAVNLAITNEFNYNLFMLEKFLNNFC